MGVTTGKVSKAAPPAAHPAVRTPGAPLDAAARAYFEPRFGHDFSAVRVHADGEAAASAAALNAAAYAVGNHLVFAADQFAPHTPGGQHLLAHELAHVVQAAAAGPASSVASLEGEATRVAAAVRDGRAMPAVGGSANGVGVPLCGPPPAGAVVPLSEPSVLAVVDKVFDDKGIAYATEVKVEISVVDDTGAVVTTNRRFDRVFTEAGDFVFLEGKGANPDSLTPAQKLVDRLAQEKGATFKVVEVGGKPPGGVAVRSLPLTKGFAGTLKPGAMQHVSGAVGGSRPATATNSMDVHTWRGGMNEKFADVAPGSTAVRYTKPNAAPEYIPQADVSKVTPPPKPKPPTLAEMPRPLKPPTRLPPPGEVVPDEFLPPGSRTPPREVVPDEFLPPGSRTPPGRVADVAGEAVQATDPVVEPEWGRPPQTRVRVGVPGEPVVPPRVRVDVSGAARTAAVEAEAAAGTGAAVAGAGRYGRALRIGGNIAVMVGLYILQKIVAEQEQARAKADMEKLVPQIDARVEALSGAIIDQQIAAPWAPAYVQVTITQTFSVVESLAAGSSEMYVGTTFGGVSLAGGPRAPVVTPRAGPRFLTFSPAGANASYQLDRDITYTEPCKRLTYDELIAHVNEMIAAAPEEKRDELKAKAARLQQLKTQANARAAQEEKQRKADLIAKVEAPPAPPPQPKPQSMVLNPAELAPAAPAAAIGPFGYQPAPQPTEKDRVDYLFAKRDYLAAVLGQLDRNDAAAVGAFKAERDTWGARLQFLHGRLKPEWPELARRLGELFDWVKNDGRRLWELP